MVWLYIFSSLVLAYVGWNAVTLFNNYIEARKIGLPILICPVHPLNPFWQLFKGRLIPIISSLPFGLGDWAPRAEVGWTFGPKFRVHAEYGEAFIIVSPGTNEIYLADPAAAEDVVRRRNVSHCFLPRSKY